MVMSKVMSCWSSNPVFWVEKGVRGSGQRGSRELILHISTTGHLLSLTWASPTGVRLLEWTSGGLEDWLQLPFLLLSLSGDGATGPWFGYQLYLFLTLFLRM